MDRSKLMRDALDSLPFPVTTVDPEGTILFVNSVAATNLSSHPEGAVGRSLYSFFPEQEAATRQRIKQTIGAREAQQFESVVVLPDGSERYFRSEYCPTFDQSGAVCCVQIVARDVTRIQRAQRLADEAEKLWGLVSDDLSMTTERVRAILAIAPVIISIHDTDGTIRYINRGTGGTTPQSVVGSTPLDWVHPSSRRRVLRAFTQAAGGEVVECEFVGKSGAHWFSRIAPMALGGEVRQLLSCTLDITQRKHLQEQLLQKRKTESLGTMARGIAHDFNNILTAIMGDLDLARALVPADGPAGGHLAHASAAASRAAELCSQMLIYGGGNPPAQLPGHLNAVIRGIRQLTRATLHPNIRVHYDLADSLPATSCNSPQLSQIVLNLVNNAADAIGEGPGVIEIKTDQLHLETPPTGFSPEPPRPGAYVRLVVQDNGQGMDANSRELIFDPFFSTKESGHGLGLSVVQGILATHRAAIAVESEVGRGTTMTVMLPIADTALEEPHSPAAQLPAARGTVLVVDDEAGIRRVTKLALSRAGCEVLVAKSGDAALELLSKLPPNTLSAVLLDVMMPGRDGYSTLRALRSSHPELPVILSSGNPIEVPGDDRSVLVLRKPYTMQELIEVVGRAVDLVPRPSSL